MSDGHPDWTVDLQSGDTRVDTSAGPTTPSQPTTPEAGQATPTPTAPPSVASPQVEHAIPKYRFDEVNTRAAQVAEENRQLRDLLNTLAAQRTPPPPAAPAPMLSEEQQAYAQQTEEIRQEFFKRFPEFASQAEKLAAIEAQLAALAPVAEVVPQMQDRENKYWGTVASNTLRTLHQTVSTALLNGAPLAPNSEQGLHVSRSFFQWTNSTPDRISRYEANDPSLVQDFLKYFGDTYVTPWRGPATPAVNPAREAAARVARLPNAGPSTIPGPVAPARDTSTEEAVHRNAWSVVQNLQHAVGREEYPTMAGTDTQIIGGALKTVYEDFVADAVNNKFPLKDLFKWQQVEYAGQEVVYDAHVTRNVSPMFVGEDSAIADAGAQGHIKVHIGQKKLMARIRMTSESIYDSMKSEGAFVSARKDEMTRLIDDIARIEEYALGSDGRGVIALVTTGANSVTQTVSAPGGIAGADFGNRFFVVGMYVGFVNPATGALRASSIRKVTAVAAAGTAITIDSAFSSTTGDYVVQAANSAVTDILDTSYEHGFWGLMALFDDGTYRNNYFNVDRSQYGQWQTYVKAATGALSLDLLQQTADVVDQKLGGEIDLITCHHAVRRLYIKLTEADRRYSAANLMKPDGGTVAMKQGDLTMGEVPIKAIRTHPLASMFLLDSKNSGMVCYGSEKGKWVDEDGRVLIRVGVGSTARDAFEAWYRMRKQWHVRYPGKSARFDGISGQSLVVVQSY